ncbi:hypothetical protein [Streptomyces iconiensis]|uniref:Uncharacterized protein n=1 Tax=Streptomyces iconiensis TaxID=1384038 RepID=A0ABT6ZTR5_9ACTN|nr:hypothetical protein [Streptomyces iconiensis]MDJ1132451.1 hypothetical protein [Streptomyces iconiensis]
MPELCSENLGRVGLEREQRRDASRYVLRHARSRADLRHLLDALGLTTSEPETHSEDDAS